jgi:hypothetical protein
MTVVGHGRFRCGNRLFCLLKPTDAVDAFEELLLQLRPRTIIVIRGPATLDEHFDLSACYGDRGRALLPDT